MEIEGKDIPDWRNDMSKGPKGQKMLISIFMDWWLEHWCMKRSKRKAVAGSFTERRLY